MKYCVTGNISKEPHTDDSGVVRYGTADFTGGRKIYISRRLWKDEVVVLGLNRFRRYVTATVPLALIENIKATRSFKPEVIAYMTNSHEFPDMWWLYKEEDRIGSVEYAEVLKLVKAGDKEALHKYNEEVMYRYYFGRDYD